MSITLILTGDSQPGSSIISRTVKVRARVTQEWQPKDKDYERWTAGSRKTVAEGVCQLVWDYAEMNGQKPGPRELPGRLQVIFSTHTRQE